MRPGFDVDVMSTSAGRVGSGALSGAVGAAAPLLLVLIWSSGFVAARWAVPHAAPQLILLARMGLAAALLTILAVSTGATWPTGRRLAPHLLAGTLLNGIYLCVSWWAIARGVPAGVISLLGALQPLVVGVSAFALFGQTLPMRGCIGLGVALAGVVLVLRPLLGTGTPVPTYVVCSAVASVLAISAGTMMQSGSMRQDDVLVSGALQNLAGALVAALAAFVEGDYRWDNSIELWFGLAWVVVLVSVSALSLLVWLTRNQGATRVSILMLLTPPLAALEARLIFGEHLSSLQILGFALALGGVVLTRSKVGGEPPRRS